MYFLLYTYVRSSSSLLDPIPRLTPRRKEIALRKMDVGGKNDLSSDALLLLLLFALSPPPSNKTMSLLPPAALLPLPLTPLWEFLALATVAHSLVPAFYVVGRYTCGALTEKCSHVPKPSARKRMTAGGEGGGEIASISGACRIWRLLQPFRSGQVIGSNIGQILSTVV